MKTFFRSMLYVPANSWRMINSAIAGSPDAIIIDLEDAVPPDEKETGRVFARDSLASIKAKGISAFVRTNSLDSGLIEKDLEYILTEHLDGILLPKTAGAKEIRLLDELIGIEERRRSLQTGRTKILPLIESPLGITNALEIGSGSCRVIGLAFGAGDYLREMGVGFSVTRLNAEDYYSATLYARSHLAVIANILDIAAIDTPFFGLIIDMQGLIKECASVRLLGYSGKQLIHPKHIFETNRIFSPSDEDIEYASSIISAYEEAKSRGAGSASYGGRMIDNAMYKMSHELLAIARAISEKNGNHNP